MHPLHAVQSLPILGELQSSELQWLRNGLSVNRHAAIESGGVGVAAAAAVAAASVHKWLSSVRRSD